MAFLVATKKELAKFFVVRPAATKEESTRRALLRPATDKVWRNHLESGKAYSPTAPAGIPDTQQDTTAEVATHQGRASPHSHPDAPTQRRADAQHVPMDFSSADAKRRSLMVSSREALEGRISEMIERKALTPVGAPSPTRNGINYIPLGYDSEVDMEPDEWTESVPDAATRNEAADRHVGRSWWQRCTPRSAISLCANGSMF